MRRHAAVFTTLAIAGGLLTAVAGPAAALDLVVDDTTDGPPVATDCTPVPVAGACSLRDAVEAANASVEADVITLPEGTFQLDHVGALDESNYYGDLDLLGETTFVGAPGPDLTTIQQDVISPNKDRNFDLHGDSTEPVTFQNLTIQYGYAPGGAGGGIRTLNQDVTLDDVILRENQAEGHGGGIYTDSADIVGTDLLFDGNVAGAGLGSGDGGAIHSRFGNVTIDPSQFYLNSAVYGGAIAVEGGDVTLLDVTMNENSAELNGGAIYGGYDMADSNVIDIDRSVLFANSASDGGAVYIDGDNANLSVVNSTFSENEVSDQGGAIHNDANTNLVHVTLYRNRAMDPTSASSIFNLRAVTITNSILTAQTGANCTGNTGAIVSAGVNLVTDSTCNPSDADIEALPLLLPLADNGGATLTHAPRIDSPAIDAAGFDVCGSDTSAVQEDQRGVGRPIGPQCDIGAFEAPLPVIDLSVTPEAAVNLIGKEHTIQIQLTSMSPVAGRSVYVRVDAADPSVELPQFGVSVDDEGRGEFSYIGSWTGTDNITVFVDLDGDGEPGLDDPIVVVTKQWTPIGRFFGIDRLLTAIDVSQDLFEDDEADVVVLARADDFADALAGTPLAVENNGPMLLTPTAALDERIADEIERVLPEGATVFLLGGTNALSAAVESAVQALGFETDRIEGPTRIETSVAVNERLTDYNALLITTGYDFPDALAAGAAAAYSGGAVVLTTAEVPHPATTAFIESKPDFDQYGIGGPAARAYPDAMPVFGPSREETAVAVAEEFFRDDPEIVGLARRDVFADALTGGVHAVFHGAPMLLTPSDQLHPAVAAYICAHEIAGAYLYGGTAALSQAVEDQVGEVLSGEGCTV